MLKFNIGPLLAFESMLESRVVKSARGKTLRCKSWRQEGILRLLENTMENAEHPNELIIYGAQGRCARNWACFDKIVDSLRQLENDETLAIQSGMPAAIFKTHEDAPRVVMANTNILKATWETFYDLQDKGLTMFAQYTAGAWGYIGTQGVIQGTYETLAAIARKKFGGSLEGKVVLTAGLGGMGGNQPRAVTMLGGVCIAVEVDKAMLERRKNIGYVDTMVSDITAAANMAKEYAAKRKPLGIGLLGNAAEVIPVAGNFIAPDVVTDMTPCHDPLYYVPIGITVEEAAKLREEDQTKYLSLARKSIVKHMQALLDYQKKGIEVFEYGNCIRRVAYEAGLKTAYEVPNFVAAHIRPLFCEGRGPFRWICLSGEATDLRKLDDLVLSEFHDDPVVTNWIEIARKNIPIEGLPARICYLGYGERARFGTIVNGMVADGELAGPVGITRDNLDSGSVTNPTFESEYMKDGSDLISDWPMLNALLDCAAGADVVAIQANYSMGEASHTGVSVIADGSSSSERRVKNCLTTDPGIGVVRHAQAGYEIAREVAKKQQIRIPIFYDPSWAKKIHPPHK